MKLNKHIKTHHNGNKSEFARSQGVKPFQVNRWIKLDCIWHNGKVYQPKT